MAHSIIERLGQIPRICTCAKPAQKGGSTHTKHLLSVVAIRCMHMDDSDELAASIEASLMGAADSMAPADGASTVAAKLSAADQENQKYASHTGAHTCFQYV